MRFKYIFAILNLILKSQSNPFDYYFYQVGFSSAASSINLDRVI